jgi:DtxR family Mn-dependent transcriptional regulator
MLLETPTLGFLVEKLDFSWDEVHEIAEQLEHINQKTD